MKRVGILKQLEEKGVIAVVRGESIERAFRTCEAIVAGDIRVLEITFTIEGADQLIHKLKAAYADDDIVIGAGTVLDATTARIAILAGASFIVSPTFDKATAKLCNLYQVPYLPGCLSPQEVQTALTYGVDIIKLFPGNVFGPSYIKAVKGPFPYVSMMPSGGVSTDNIKEWIDSGAVAVGVGGNLTAPAEQNDFAAVTDLARAYSEAFQKAKRGDSA